MSEQAHGGGRIEIIQELQEKCDAENQFERFDTIFRQVISVPKAAVDKEEATLKRQKQRAKAKAPK